MLTQKERSLLEDEKKHEELCVKKYTQYASEAEDPALQTVFSNILKHEQQHLDTINSMLKGEVPSPSSGQNSNSQSASNNAPTSQTGFSQRDCDMCQDALATEKFISSTYNTAIFEFTNTNSRQMLNHIQKEEQEHGEQIYNYMEQKGYY
ncbi:spore coat protein [Sporanaerobium hydrogeniformans]|uniref:Spore coat protein n=1 Tax=Sporanaerobium hydrogeniformans TaxID=3072179 RepID=A0AC61D9X3_9FIRM|nr:demethoxyubiquinone hydroxylase family protein [Sporanaerobium hydrogeniformans]PHV70069.1 spore coat protein [Sporanaerobium hydrogeniformans]